MGSRPKDDAAGAPGPDRARPPVPRRDLARECETFTRYLTGEAPTAYAVDQYVDAHRARPEELGPPDAPYGRLLLRLARRGPRWTWLLDCHARVWSPACTLRSKLVLLVAVLESSPPSCRRFHRASTESSVRVLLRLAGRGAAFAGGLVLTTLALLPVRAGMRLATGDGAREPADADGVPEGHADTEDGPGPRSGDA